ncbi:MAG: hypothetical protein J6M66_13520 [Lachnospiraceae bacterium]|nr:hypothetical protein [Lachnospiraceae bacterium]
MAETTDIVHVTIGEDVIDTTPNHPFYIEGYGFKPASELKAGDKVRLLDGTNAEIRSAVTERLDEPVKVYNFEVEDWHTYYVAGAGAVGVEVTIVILKIQKVLGQGNVLLLLKRKR